MFGVWFDGSPIKEMYFDADPDRIDFGLHVEHPFGSIMNATLDGYPIDDLMGARMYHEMVTTHVAVCDGRVTVTTEHPEIAARIERGVLKELARD
jgi:hypothetical protein